MQLVVAASAIALVTLIGLAALISVLIRRLRQVRESLMALEVETCSLIKAIRMGSEAIQQRLRGLSGAEV